MAYPIMMEPEESWFSREKNRLLQKMEELEDRRLERLKKECPCCCDSGADCECISLEDYECISFTDFQADELERMAEYCADEYPEGEVI